ncbi:SPOR domain-containing protein [Lysobacter solisilvae (ex Woo and Kim 2020)]|uniref:SPOR domain-containing protein n=1 Tax=Agrilutibacter terrestris TaxID=2865112 RepID=A0A7H0FV99_9GAMM|nr:SPOR domain-containing protein [Lysobacter terrestris]QNP39965.1 SPOR domain-containing protein [Lysobacter terrestris]
MEPALKQRVVGAVVLVALAVIFLPMLIKGPAPESGVSDVPLDLPAAPQGDGSLQTRELPLVAPGAAPTSGVVGMDASQPEATAADGASTGMQPAATAGGDYAVTFGRYATAADADKVVAALRNAQLPGYQEAVSDKGRALYGVRIGPFATQADAESARLRAAQVRDDVGAKVIALNADAASPATAAPSPAPAQPAASQPIAAASAPVSRPEPLAETRPAAPKPTAPTPAKPVAPKPAAPAPVATTAKPVAPAAAGTGFAVQLGAFSSAEEATKLRDRARAAGLRAFVESVRTDKGVLSRVRVGPVLTRAEADQLKAQVAAKLGIGDAIVKPHP